MTTEQLRQLFEKHERDEYLEYDRINFSRPSKSKDICAFLLLDSLAPTGFSILEAVGDYGVWLSTNLEELAAVITEEQVITLIRYGVEYKDDLLFMNV